MLRWAGTHPMTYVPGSHLKSEVDYKNPKFGYLCDLQKLEKNAKKRFPNKVSEKFSHNSVAIPNLIKKGFQQKELFFNLLLSILR